MITLQEAHTAWLEYIQPTVVEQFGENDRPALAESWAGFTDSLTRDGELTGLQYHYAPSHDDDMPDDDIEYILECMGVGVTVTRISDRPDDLSEWGAGAHHWKFTITRGKQEHTGYYSQGSAHTVIPTLTDVLSCLLSDAQYGEYDFDEFCDDLGYDTDSRRAERIHRACIHVAAGMSRLFSAAEREDLTAVFNEWA